MNRRSWWLLLGAYLVLRAALLLTPGFAVDLGQYKLWSLLAARDGLGQIYATTSGYAQAKYDYPPLYAYVCDAIGHVYSLVDPDALKAQRDSAALTALVKVPPLLFDLAIAALLVAVARTRRRAEPGAAGAASESSQPWSDVIPALAYLLNPAVLFDSGHWGQPDAIHSGFALAAFVVAGGAADRVWRAWPLLALAALMKPLGAPYFPLLLVVTALRSGRRGVALGVASAAVTTLLVFTPFLAAMGARPLFERLFGDLDAMAFTSVNAHNLWWIVGPWRNTAAEWLGGVTMGQAGLVLVAIAAGVPALLAVRLHRARRAGLDGSQPLVLAALVGFGFFFVSTHMHENHGFAAIPLLCGALAAAPRGNSARRELGALFAVITASVLLNLVAHDPWFRQHAPLDWGGVAEWRGEAGESRYYVGEYVVSWIGTVLAFLAVALLAAWSFGGGLARLPWSPRAAEQRGSAA